MPKCSECLSCLDLIYFGNKRFYHCWLCDTWYDGILPNLYKVPIDEVSKYNPEFSRKLDELLKQMDNTSSPAANVETNSDK